MFSTYFQYYVMLHIQNKNEIKVNRYFLSVLSIKEQVQND